MCVKVVYTLARSERGVLGVPGDPADVIPRESFWVSVTWDRSHGDILGIDVEGRCLGVDVVGRRGSLA